MRNSRTTLEAFVSNGTLSLMAYFLVLNLVLAAFPAWAADGGSVRNPSFRDQVSEIQQAPDGRYRVRFQQRGIVYTIEEKDKSGLQCLLRSVRLLKDVNVQFDPETRKVVGCDLVVPK